MKAIPAGGLGVSLCPEDLEVVQEVEMFSGLKPEETRRLLRGAHCRWYPRGALLFIQGDAADRFFVVLEGRVKLVKTTTSGTESVVEVFTRGKTFGEAAMFASRRFPVGAEVLVEAKLLQVGAESFLDELSRSPDLSLKVLASLARRHHELIRQLHDLRLKSPSQRLGMYLLSLVGDATGRAVAHLPIDKGAVAGRIGVTPESLSRALLRLKRFGVTCRGRQVVLNDVQVLRIHCLDEAGTPPAVDDTPPPLPGAGCDAACWR
ncbi:MAG: Crp/Fnr family transcriptional regulator [Alphaproteobacteria bacterium]